MLWRLSPGLYKRIIFRPFRKISWAKIRNLSLEPEHLLLYEFLPEEGCFIDVGANKGEYIYTALQCISAKNIFAFEPNPIWFSRLKKIFPTVNLFELALYDHRGSSSLKVPYIKSQKYPTRGTLKIDFFEPGETGHSIYPVEMETLDNLIDDSVSQISLIKIDVEGVELQVLTGAKKTIEKYKPVLIIEIEQRHHKRPIKTVLQDIEAMGYQTHILNRTTERLENRSGQLSTLPDRNTNFIFVPQEKE